MCKDVGDKSFSTSNVGKPQFPETSWQNWACAVAAVTMALAQILTGDLTVDS